MHKSTIAAIAAVSCLELILQLVAVLLGLPLAIVCGAVTPVLSSFVFTSIELSFTNRWWLLAQSAGASLAGVVLAWATLPFRPSFALAPIAACASAGILAFINRWQAEQCALCKNRLIGELSFQCPRCDLRVCEQQCWDFMGCRCRLCQEHRVPIFAEDTRWWDRNLGARASYGRCQLCQENAADVDLRFCGNCGRPQCRDCWDIANGTCSRCQWTVRELPERLRAYVAETHRTETRSRTEH